MSQQVTQNESRWLVKVMRPTPEFNIVSEKEITEYSNLRKQPFSIRIIAKIRMVEED